MMRRTFFFLFSFLLANGASAINEENLTLTKLGVQGTNAYFSVQERFELACKYQVVYMPITTNFGKFAYAQLLTVKALNKPISRIGYVQGTNDICVLTLIELNE